jgi:hypothetical protein
MLLCKFSDPRELAPIPYGRRAGSDSGTAGEKGRIYGGRQVGRDSGFEANVVV